MPWPVEQGFVSEKFGINVHPVFKQVKLNNAGITITTSRNADVRAVFKGVVTEIMFIPGDNNVVIVLPWKIILRSIQIWWKSS